jgi:hypothetical protein
VETPDLNIAVYLHPVFARCLLNKKKHKSIGFPLIEWYEEEKNPYLQGRHIDKL